MNEDELAAIVLALRQVQAPPQDEPEFSAWRLAARFPELDLAELRAMSGGRGVS